MTDSSISSGREIAIPENFQKALRDFSEQDYRQPFGNLNSSQLSKLLAKFFVEKIIKRLQPYLISDDPDDYADNFVDGSNDGGTDFLARTDNNVLILQVKYRGAKARATTEDKIEARDFSHILKRLESDTGKKQQRIRDIASEINWETDNFFVYYVTTGSLDESFKSIAKDVINPPEIDLAGRIEVEVYDEKDLGPLYKDAVSSITGTTKPVVFTLSQRRNRIWLEYEKEGREAYIGTIESTQLYKIFTTDNHRHSLFNLNVREPIKSKINTDIIQTAVDHPSDFFFFNNGISAVATKITADEKTGKMVCDNFSVINGAQTLRSLCIYHSVGGRPAVDVLIRVTKISFSAQAKDESFLNNVTRFNNTQNTIKTSDFRSNDPIQKDVAKSFAALPARDGKRGFIYKHKRSESVKRDYEVITMDELLKNVYSFSYGPPEMLPGGVSSIYNADAGGAYADVFGNGKEVWRSLSDSDFRRLAGIWFICEQVKGNLKAYRSELIAKEKARAADGGKSSESGVVGNALERKYLLIFAVGEYFRTAYSQDEALFERHLIKLSHPGWTSEKQTTPQQILINKATRACCKVLINLFTEEKEQAGFNVRNWYRSRSTVEGIKRRIFENVDENDTSLQLFQEKK